MGALGGKIGEGVVRYWPPTNSFLLFGVLTSVTILVKIDQEMRPWECPQTDRHTYRQTQTDFIICPMLYAIAMGQIIRYLNIYTHVRVIGRYDICPGLWWDACVQTLYQIWAKLNDPRLSYWAFSKVSLSLGYVTLWPWPLASWP